MDQEYLENNGWFTKGDIERLSRKFSTVLDEVQAKALEDHLNGSVHQFIHIAWRLRNRKRPTDICKLLDTLQNAGAKLLKALDNMGGEVIEYLAIGAAESAGTSPELNRHGMYIAELRKEKMDKAEHLVSIVPEAIQALLNGIPFARKIYIGRKERTKIQHSQNKGEKDLDELLWNLLKGWKYYLRKKVNYWDESQPSIKFVHECLQIIRSRLPTQLCQDSKLMNVLNANRSALRERVSNLRKRMMPRFRQAQHFRNMQP